MSSRTPSRLRPALLLGLPVFALACAGAAGAWPSNATKKNDDKPAMTGAAPAAVDTAPAFKKASAADIQAMLRSDPLTQAAYFAEQFDHDPTDAQMGLRLSNALRALGRNTEAADTAHKVLLFAPNNVDVLMAAARAHIADNNAFYAIDPLQQIITLKPKDWQAYSLIGVAYDQVKRTDDAQVAWATALKLSPNNATVLTNIAMAKVQAGDLAGAEPLLRTAAAQKDATLQVRQNLALVLGLEGKMAEAEKLLRQDLPPQQADANLAWLQQNSRAAPAVTAPTSGPAPTRSWDSLKAAGS